MSKKEEHAQETEVLIEKASGVVARMEERERPLTAEEALSRSRTAVIQGKLLRVIGFVVIACAAIWLLRHRGAGSWQPLLVGVTGLLVTLAANDSLRRNRFAANRAEEHPEEPWLHVLAWDGAIIDAGMPNAWWGAWLLTGMGVAGMALMLTNWEVMNGAGGFFLFLLAMLTVFLAVVAWQFTYCHRRYGHARLELLTFPGCFGACFVGVARVPRRISAQGAISVSLTNLSIRGGANGNSIGILWRGEYGLDTADLGLADGETLIPIAFRLAAEGEPTHAKKQRDDKVSWQLELKGDGAWKHFCVLFDVPVFRLSASAKDAMLADVWSKADSMPCLERLLKTRGIVTESGRPEPSRAQVERLADVLEGLAKPGLPVEEVSRLRREVLAIAEDNFEVFQKAVHEMTPGYKGNLSGVYEALAEEPDRWIDFMLAEMDRLFVEALVAENPSDVLSPLGSLVFWVTEEEGEAQIRILNSLEARLAAPETPIRRTAVDLIGWFTQSRNRQVVDRLRGMLTNDPDWRVRHLAWQTLSDLEELPDSCVLSLPDRLRARFLGPFV